MFSIFCTFFKSNASLVKTDLQSAFGTLPTELTPLQAYRNRTDDHQMESYKNLNLARLAAPPYYFRSSRIRTCETNGRSFFGKQPQTSKPSCIILLHTFYVKSITLVLYRNTQQDLLDIFTLILSFRR